YEWVNVKDLKSATPRPDIKLHPTATDVMAAGFLPKAGETEPGPVSKFGREFLEAVKDVPVWFKQVLDDARGLFERSSRAEKKINVPDLSNIPESERGLVHAKVKSVQKLGPRSY